MYQLDSLDFLSLFSAIQCKKGGVGEHVKIIDIQRASGLKRSLVYYHVNKLIKRGFIKKLAWGQYCVSWSWMTATIGASVLTSWDVIELHLHRDDFMKQFKHTIIGDIL